MTTSDFITYAVLHVPSEFIDDLCDEYDVDFSDDDIIDMLNCCAGDVFHKSNFRNVGGMLIKHVFMEIIEKYSDVLDEDKFDYHIDGADSCIYYNEEIIENKSQLDFIYNEELERQLKED